jgi:hypothetical protein
MAFGTWFQLVGAAVALIWALVVGQYWIAGFIGLHLTGDAIMSFLLPLLGIRKFEEDAKKFIKLRGFLFFVGWALMVCFHFASHVDWKVNLLFFSFHITSLGLFLLGAMVAIVGAFTYPDMYT